MSESKPSPKNILYINCPTCDKKSPWQENRFRPFCSERCKLKDLGNWAAEKYTIPTQSDITESQDDESL